jgi:hypothetical protein
VPGESEADLQLLEVAELVRIGVMACVMGVYRPVGIEVPGHCDRPQVGAMEGHVVAGDTSGGNT